MGSFPHPDSDLIAVLRERIQTVLRPLVPRGAPVALLDFPDYGNVGDSAIWLGELRALESLEIGPIVYTCDASTYSRRQLAVRIGQGPLLFTGGGNFGDLYPRHQLFRERVLADFPDNPAIFLPQTIHFEDDTSLVRARASIDAHRHVTILARDSQSREFASRHFQAEVQLCPDAAFSLGPLVRPCSARQAVVTLARRDFEATERSRSTDVPEADSVDWMDESSLTLTTDRLVRGAFIRFPNRLAALRPLVSALYGRLARERLANGCRVLSQGSTVVTDRLHGHILCLLIGIPHLMVDNSYGKLSGFYETWTRGSMLARWCDSWPEARALAAAELEGP